MTIYSHQLHDTYLYQINYSLFVFYVFLLIFILLNIDA